MAIETYAAPKPGCGDLKMKIAAPKKHAAAKKLIVAPTFQFLNRVAFINVREMPCCPTVIFTQSQTSQKSGSLGRLHAANLSRSKEC
ncbi:MAG: hypothetical protein V9H26_10255, partial [Verrucomicrobiota bacterium]